MPWQPLPGHGDAGPRRVGESLDRVASSLGASKASTLTAVFAAWPELVGEAVAANVRPRSLRDGTLVVTAVDPAWATSMRWLEADLLRRLGEVAGEGAVAAVEVRVARPD